jgi:miniconductance mechanosensitive channel
MQALDRLSAFLERFPLADTGLTLLALLLVAALADWLTRSVLLRMVRRVVEATTAKWDDALLARGVLSHLSHVVPAMVVAGGIHLVPNLPADVVTVVGNVARAYVVLAVALSLGNLSSAIGDIYGSDPKRAQARPIKGYLQVARIVVYVLAAIAVFATLAGTKFVHVVTGLGAMTAVTMLIFQDTILSFVASVQIASDGRVRVGDWIEMPSQNADGDVTDIALHTVTVQNWDKTITTIPTKKLISESFKNWRGMTEAGGRRIKRALYLDQKSVCFLDQAANWTPGTRASRPTAPIRSMRAASPTSARSAPTSSATCAATRTCTSR